MFQAYGMQCSVMSSPFPAFRRFSVSWKEVAVSGFLGYKLQKTQLTRVNSKAISISIQNNIYLLSTYCVSGSVKGTGSACNKPSSCPQLLECVYILIFPGQEVLGWTGVLGIRGVCVWGSGSTMSSGARFFASFCSASFCTSVIHCWACCL